MTTFLLIVLGSFVWLGLGAFGSAMSARYFWEQYGDTLGFSRADQFGCWVTIIFGLANMLGTLTSFGYHKPLWDWSPKPPRDPRFRKYWAERNREE